MKHLKQTIACGAAVLALTTSALAAPAYGSLAEAAAGVTGKTLEEVLAERPGKSCGMGCVQGQGRGQGLGCGQGRGMGLRDGSCRTS